MSPLPPFRHAAVIRKFGPVSGLAIAAVPYPGALREGDLLVRSRASSVNPIEWKMRQGLGLPHWLWKLIMGHPPIPGIDFSGTVIQTGPGKARYRVGDAVMGALPICGAHATVIRVRGHDPKTAVTAKPPSIDDAEAGVVSFAGLVALAGLIGADGSRPLPEGARILVVGASGGVGHLAMQMARCLGASFVVGVCHSRNADFVRECGADAVIAHDSITPGQIVRHHPYWQNSFDLILDAVGIDTYWTEVAPVLLRPSGRFSSIALPQPREGSPGEDLPPFAAMRLLLKLWARRLGGKYSIVTGLMGGLPTRQGMHFIAQWLSDGRLRPRIGATFDLRELSDAHLLSQKGGVAGKIAIRMEHDELQPAA